MLFSRLVGVASCVVWFTGCGASAPPANFLKAPALAGTTELRVREVVVGPGAKNKAYYTADGKKEVIPPRFAEVSFINDKVGYAYEGTPYRIRFDITGATPPVIDAMPYRLVRTFDLGRTTAAALSVRRGWYGIAAPSHKVQCALAKRILFRLRLSQGSPTQARSDNVLPWVGLRCSYFSPHAPVAAAMWSSTLPMTARRFRCSGIRSTET